MKHFSRRVCALALSLLMAWTMFPISALAAEALSYTTTTALGRGLTLDTLNSRAASGNMRQQFTLNFTPGGGVSPLVLYGNKLYGKSNINTAISYAKSLGYTVLSAVNADYFFMASGIPTGMTIQNGRLCTSDGKWNAVGFFSDGRAMVGAPQLQLSFTRADGSSRPIYALNNVRTGAGIYLYTTDFATDTKTTAAGTEVVLQLTPGDYLALGRPLTATVLSVGKTKATAIGPNQVVLSVTDANTPGLSLSDLQPGETLQFNATTTDPAWNSVQWCSGGGNMLVRNGAITSDASSDIAPRTVLGVRADGSTVVLECDGRQSSISAGMSTAEAAQQLLSQGCVNVVNLDGGGSSAIAAAYPGKDAQLLSSPSDGSPRACATYILFVSNGPSQDGSVSSTVYPRGGAILAGGQTEISAVTHDGNYQGAAPYSGGYTASAGTMTGNVFTAPDTTGQVTISAAGMDSQSGVLTVVNTIEKIKITRSGSSTALTALSMEPGQTADLNVTASNALGNILCQDRQFTFTVSGGVGTIDENGVFTAGKTTASGSITVSYGGVRATLSVSVKAKPSGLVDGFETGSWSAAGSGNFDVSINTAAENVRYGSGSLALTYGGTDDSSYALYTATEQTLANASFLSLMGKGSGSWQVRFRLADGSTDSRPFTLSGDSWQFVSVAVPETAVAFSGFYASGAGEQSAWLDQLLVHYGAAEQDIAAPTITVTESTASSVKATVSDHNSTALTKDNLRVLVDGASRSFTFTASSGQVSCTVPTGGLHRVTIIATDSFGNIARRSVDVGAIESSYFGDMLDHWAAGPVEYLRLKGVFSDDKAFSPETQVNNAMSATMISRYLGIDTAQFDSVALPFTDADQIPQWALPHVRAMYAMGIIKGTVNSSGHSVFRPNDPCARSQIMTILSRTLGRGYSYSACAFDDAADIPAWARDHIDLLAGLGIVGGYGGTNNVKPNGNITRAEFASLLYKLY